jgi:hypothetical protein
MSLVRKLKPDRSITGALPLVMLPIFGVVSLIFGFRAGLLTLAVLIWGWALFYLYVFLRTWNWSNLFVCVWGAYLGYMVTVLTGYVGTNDISPEFGIAYITGLVFFGLGMIYLVATRKFKWRGREIFELAGEPVEETGDGYTDRPRPVGKVAYSPEQMRSFSRFAARHLIALPYITSRNITLVPVKMGDEYGRLLGLLGDYRDATWVNFDIDGDVSVHIAQKDYLEYRQALAFDQLCASLGQVFIDFCDLYSKGEGSRIIDRMDDLKIGVLS